MAPPGPHANPKVPVTTRKPRKNEVHGRNYFFVSEADFQALIDQDRLQEHGELKGNLYGTLRPKQGGTSPKGERMVRTATYKGAVASGLGSHLAEGGVYDHRVPITTRAPREGEVNGKNYHFVSREEFESLVADDRLKEFGERNGVFYGSAKPATGSAKGRRLKRSGTYSGAVARGVYKPEVPLTTRAPREGEVEGENYYFVSREAFETLMAAGRLREHGESNGVYYGSVKVASGKEDGTESTLQRSGTYKSAVGENGAAAVRYDPRVPLTTRAPREGEVDGQNYYFVSREDFESLMAAGALREHGEANGVYYGSVKSTANGSPPRLTRSNTYKGAIAGPTYDYRVPLTTRAPREGEVEGKDYYFVTEDVFRSLAAEDRLREQGERNGVLYGSVKPGDSAPPSPTKLARSNTYKESIQGGPRGSGMIAVVEEEEEEAAVEEEEAAAPPTDAASALEWDSGFFKVDDAAGVVDASGKALDADAAQPKALRINMWSGPRCMSTAVMYSFAQRSDTTVLDEPLYAHHLVQRPEIERPYRAKLLETQQNDGNDVIRGLILGHAATPVVFSKHMAKQFVNLPTEWLRECHNVFLVRNPVSQLSSYAAKIEPGLEELAWPQLMSIFSFCRSEGLPFSVIDANVLQRDPRGVLTQLCADAGLAFEEEMLSWPAGPKPYDGCWGSFWYESVHKSTGFAEQSPQRELTPEFKLVAEDSFPFYMAMSPYIIGARGAQQLRDDRNRSVLAWVGHGLVPRAFACLSVFDSAVQAGDAVYATARVYNGRILDFDAVLRQLFKSARALCFAAAPTDAAVRDAVTRTLSANGMRDGVHIRIILTRGEKNTTGANPADNTLPSTLVVMAEWCDAVAGGAPAQLATAPAAGALGSGVRHCNLLSSTLPRLSAAHSGASDAIVVNADGNVAGTTSAALFCVEDGIVITPAGSGVVRAAVVTICGGLGIAVQERNLSVSEVHTADEVFTADTQAEITPVDSVDGRVIGAPGAVGDVTKRIQAEFRARAESSGWPLPGL